MLQESGEGNSFSGGNCQIMVLSKLSEGSKNDSI